MGSATISTINGVTIKSFNPHLNQDYRLKEMKWSQNVTT